MAKLSVDYSGNYFLKVLAGICLAIFSLFAQNIFAQEEISTADYDIYIKDTILLDVSQMELLPSTSLTLQKTLKFKPKKDGYKTYFYISGYKNCAGLLLNKKRKGDWISWYDSGHISSVIHFINGLKQDSCTYWYSNGNLNACGQYKDDLKEGEWIFYHPDGTFKGTYYYRKGVLYNKQ